jgi:hypothetical protein
MRRFVAVAVLSLSLFSTAGCWVGVRQRPVAHYDRYDRHRYEHRNNWEYRSYPEYRR